jgi:hypothetical protein
MIRIDEDYIIDVDPHNYIVKRDLHKERVTVNDETGEETRTPVFNTVGYFGDIPSAVRGIIRDMNRTELSGGVFSLTEAVKMVQDNNKRFYDLLDRAFEEA